MSNLNNPFNSLRTLNESEGKYYYSLPALEASNVGPISRLPVSIRIVLESVLRNCDGKNITEDEVKRLANWNAKTPSLSEIPFVVSRIVLQDFTGVPLLVDLAAMRSAVDRLGIDAKCIEPLVPVDLVVDHSVQVDRSGTVDAFKQNLSIEFERNRERYEFLKWGQQAFETFQVVPPSIGIVHQVNLEYLARVVFEKIEGDSSILYPDTLVGTDSHTTMVNGLGVVGWGVGGIEAEAGMLGQPVYFQTPEVIGVNMTGSLCEGVTATDLALHVTELLRSEKVVGKFVEFYGEGTENLTLADRATVANMAPEYGATMGFFPIDEKTLDYLRLTGRSETSIEQVKAYFEAQGMFGIPKSGEIEYTKSLDLDLANVVPSVAGPKRPQDRIDVPELKDRFRSLFEMPVAEGGFGKSFSTIGEKVAVRYSEGGVALAEEEIGHGNVLIAAITSCTNTSNPNVMIAAGLVAKKAVEKGMTINSTVKTSLAPGSRVVTEYLEATGLQKYLDKIGFNLVGYGCTTCIGNSGPLAEPIESAIREGDLVAASVLSGNRNFEARVHGSIRANFLMSPPLVVAYALAGTVDINLNEDAIGNDSDGNPVYLKDLWPSQNEVQTLVATGLNSEMFTNQYSKIMDASAEWKSIDSGEGDIYNWKEESTYIQEPPFFDNFGMEPNQIENLVNLRPLAILGDSVTTDHISPAGAFKADTPAGKFLISKGVEAKNFNSYGSRRGNDKIMTRGTFANVRIKNRMADGKEGGFTKLMPEAQMMSIFDACQEYKNRGIGTIIFGGVDYGMGSSRDWAAKGTNLLGAKAVVAKSFERIHRSNLLGMGVLPLEFVEGDTIDSLQLDGTEKVSISGLSNDLQPGIELEMEVKRMDGSSLKTQVRLRIDTAIEVEYYRHGGILPYVLRNIISAQ
jgi:aconitate hydratase